MRPSHAWPQVATEGAKVGLARRRSSGRRFPHQQQLTANWPLLGSHTHLVLSNYAAIMKARLLQRQVAERSPRRMSDADKARHERDDKRTAIRWTMSTIQANEQTTNVGSSIKSFTVKVNGKLSGGKEAKCPFEATTSPGTDRYYHCLCQGSCTTGLRA